MIFCCIFCKLSSIHTGNNRETCKLLHNNQCILFCIFISYCAYQIYFHILHNLPLYISSLHITQAQALPIFLHILHFEFIVFKLFTCRLCHIMHMLWHIACILYCTLYCIYCMLAEMHVLHHIITMFCVPSSDKLGYCRQESNPKPHA